MQFQNPLFLLLLLIIPVFYWYFTRKHSASAISYPDIKILSEVFSVNNTRNNTLLYLRLAVLTLLIFAFARPQKGIVTNESSTKGIDIMLCVDTSGTMQALDFQPKNRMQVAKETAKEFIKARKHDRIGIVVFAGLSFTQCPLTIDHDALYDFMDKVEVGMTQVDRTAIGNALLTSVGRLKDSPGKSKIIVLLSDGRNNAGEVDPITAAKAAQSVDIKIYTVGIGVPGKALFPYQHPVLGLQYGYLPEELDENMMRQIADITGGKYFRAKTYGGFRDIFKQIDKLEKTEIKESQYTEYGELFYWFIFPALLLLLAEILLARTVYRKIP
ncbi:MAG: hypothetical protein A2252_08615 [Elusimicrobia bacterium RIFOXYA2_FULL_39_19]|nr:MAG: hypothetical protein A2252_08615 [Elusimicrobia bacterium RIFOXYA2_FULL_39_19]